MNQWMYGTVIKSTDASLIGSPWWWIQLHHLRLPIVFVFVVVNVFDIVIISSYPYPMIFDICLVSSELNVRMCLIVE